MQVSGNVPIGVTTPATRSSATERAPRHEVAAATEQETKLPGEKGPSPEEVRMAVGRANAKLDARRQESGKPSAAESRNTAAKFDAKMGGDSEGIRFSFNDSIGQLVVHVVDQNGQVLRQIPSKAFVAAEAAGVNAGLLLDKKG